MLVVRALKISQLTDGGKPPTYDSMHYSAQLRCTGILSWRFGSASLEFADEHDIDLDRSAKSHVSHSLAGERFIRLLCCGT